MTVLRRPGCLQFLAVMVTTSGCMPYTVGHTALPARERQVNVTTSLFGIDKRKNVHDAVRLRETGGKTIVEDRIAGWNYVGIDMEARAGVSNRADVGIRLASGQGVVVSYMRKLNGTTETPGPNVSVMVGAGVVNFPRFGVGEVSLLASGDEAGRVTPYGGVRAMNTFPLKSRYPHDPLTLGAFFGSRFGRAGGGISPEIGIFYDRPYQGLIKRGNLLVVPSVSIHGNPIAWLRDLTRNVVR